MIYSEYVYVKTCSHYTKDVRSFGEIRTDVFDVMILYRIVSMIIPLFRNFIINLQIGYATLEGSCLFEREN